MIVFNVVVMGVSPLTESPRKVGLRGWFLTIVMIKLAKQVFLCANSITRIGGRSKELAFALLTACHSGNLALISQDDEVALCHGADSLSQFQPLFHHKELREAPHVDGRAGATGPAWKADILEVERATDSSILVGFLFGAERCNICDTLLRRRPLSERPAAFRTHEQNRRIVERNVGPSVALLANYLIVCIEFHKVLLGRHTVRLR